VNACTHCIVAAIFCTSAKVCSICHQAVDSPEESDLESSIPRRLPWILFLTWLSLTFLGLGLDIYLLLTLSALLRRLALITSIVSFVILIILISWVGSDFHTTFNNVAPEIFIHEEDLVSSRLGVGYGSRLLNNNTFEGYSSGGSKNEVEPMFHDARINISNGRENGSTGSLRKSPLQQQRDLYRLLKAKYDRFMRLRKVTLYLCCGAIIVQVIRILSEMTTRQPFLLLTAAYDLGDDFICSLQCCVLFVLLWYAWTPVKGPLCCGLRGWFLETSEAESGQEEVDESVDSSSFFGSSLSFSSPHGNWTSKTHSQASDV